MAQQNVIVRLSLKDHETVVRGLQNAGAEGERALKRIEAASRTPSAGLKAFGAGVVIGLTVEDAYAVGVALAGAAVEACRLSWIDAAGQA